MGRPKEVEAHDRRGLQGSCCDAMTVVLTGNALDWQPDADGTYDLLSSNYNGRPWYQQQQPSGAQLYLFYWLDRWELGPNPLLFFGGNSPEVRSSSNINANCPAEASGWQYKYNGNWVSASSEITVSCSPPPPPPCCDAVTLTLTDAAWDAQPSSDGAYTLLPTVVRHGRPVYSQTSGSNYLYYVQGNSGWWVVGPNYDENSGGLSSFDNAQCPDQVSN